MSNLIEIAIKNENGENYIVCERKFLCNVLTACFDTQTFCREIKITEL